MLLDVRLDNSARFYIQLTTLKSIVCYHLSMTDKLNSQIVINRILVLCAIAFPFLTWPAQAKEPTRAEPAKSKERTVYLSVDGMG